MEERIVGLALQRGLLSPEALARARATLPPGASLVQALVDLGALRLEVAHTLLREAQEGSGPLQSSLDTRRFATAPGPRASGAGPVSSVGPRASGAGPVSSVGPRASGAGAVPGARASGVGPRASGAGPVSGARASGVGPRASDRLPRQHPTLGDWELLQELGRGSNGVVYRARRAGLPGEVALKVFPDAAQSGSESIARFRQEADLARRLDHPGIVRVLEAGETGPHAWYAMQLCPGETLADRLRRGPLPPREAAALVAGLARAMDHAHSRQVIHRDLKPANVILDPAGAARITDLGLARDAARERSLTRTGDVLGTPLYMAPEQLAGRRDLDRRIDVWALGVILYECLSGRRPFQAQDTMSLAGKILGEDAPPLRSAAPGLPEPLEAVCRRALAREREERLPGALELAVELERWLADSAPAPARPPEPSPALSAAVAQLPVVPVAIGAALLLALGLGVALLVTARSARRREAEAAVQAELRSAEERRRATQAEEAAFQAALLGIDPSDPASVATARERAGDDPARRTSVDDALARALAARLERLEAQAAGMDLERLLEQTRALAELAGPASELTRRSRLLAVRHQYRRGRHQEAAAGARALVEEEPGDAVGGEALYLAARAVEEEAPDQLQALLGRLAGAGIDPWSELARGYQRLTGARSVSDLEQAMAIAQGILARHPEQAGALELAARARYVLASGGARDPAGLLAETDRLLDRAHAAAPDDLHPYHWQALVKFQQRDYRGKVEVLGEAIRLSEPRPHYRSLFWRAHTLFLLQRYQEALGDVERCLQLRPDDIEALLWRPLCEQALGRGDQAQARWRQLALERPQDVDAHLQGRTATVEVQPLAEAILAAHAHADSAAAPPTPNAPTRAALDELDRRGATLAGWEELEPLVAAAERAAAGNPASVQAASLARVWTLYRRGRIDASRELARQLVASAPGTRAGLEARFAEAIGWLWNGDIRRGVDQLGELYRDDPRGPVGLSAGATWNSYNGRNMLGHLLARASLQQDPAALEPCTGLAFCLNDLGQGEQALQALEPVLKRHPDHPRALMARAMTLLNLRRLEPALEALATVVRVTEPKPIARALEMQLQVGLATGKLDLARAAAERLVALDPDNVEEAVWLAAVQAEQGQADAARATLRQAAERDAGRVRAVLNGLRNPRMRERLEQLLR